jgi:predicted GIY-YIG superfamily endonuclease
MTDYQLGKIYRIVCNTTGLTYYGSTCEPTLARRLAKHVGNYKHFKKGKKGNYMTSFEVFEGGNYTIVLVELFPCNSKMELHQKERFFIDGNDCVNKVIPTRTKAEYLNVNKIRTAKRHLEYCLKHKERLTALQSEYNLKNKEKKEEYDREYRLKNKEKIATAQLEHRSKNKEKTAEYNREYRLKNREKLAKQRLIKKDETKEETK